MGEWVKAAEVQLEMYRWMTSPKGWGYMRQWVGHERRKEPLRGEVYDMYSHAEPQKLLTANAIWVSPDMCEIVQHARESFAPEPLEREDFITHTGFVYFAKPIVMFDRMHKRVNVGAISWCPVRFTDESAEEIKAKQLEEEGTEITVMREPGPPEPDVEGIAISMYSSAVHTDEDDYSEMLHEFHSDYGVELIPLHLTVAAFGSPLNEGHLLDEKGHYTAADEWWKTVQTTLRLMQQRVFVREEARLPRPTRRRMERADHPLEEVLIIRLRRADTKRPDPEEPSGRKLTHRHLRDGHWRGQWYPSVQRHRQIWISPTIVGDESLPLVIKRRFYKWDR